MLSQGVPMLLAGDEGLRTQGGNNNAYCQDNETSWLDWSATPRVAEMLRFTESIIALRRRHPSLRRTQFLSQNQARSAADLRWYGADGCEPAWDDEHDRILCFYLKPVAAEETELFVAFNMSDVPVAIRLPEPHSWRRAVDTGLASPADIVPLSEAPRLEAASYELAASAVAVLERGPA